MLQVPIEKVMRTGEVSELAKNRNNKPSMPNNAKNARPPQKPAFELFQNSLEVRNTLLNRVFVSLNFDELPNGGDASPALIS
ncbi:MAG: hypothetical protein ABL890_04655 [Candidatus Peribacteraceae bacterium]